ncbi:hypothetical protein WCLP8_3960006 [uncultured Gammaproteobacteria bacterium]
MAWRTWSFRYDSVATLIIPALGLLLAGQQYLVAYSLEVLPLRPHPLAAAA